MAIVGCAELALQQMAEDGLGRPHVPPPPAAEASDAQAPVPDAARTNALDGLEVLLVEDDALIRMTIRHSLESLGCRVHAAASAEQAFETRTHPSIELMVSDVVLDSSALGPQIAARARELRAAGLRALYVSAHPHRLLIQRGWIDGDDLVLEKPFTREQLKDAMRDALRG